MISNYYVKSSYFICLLVSFFLKEKCFHGKKAENVNLKLCENRSKIKFCFQNVGNF